MAILDPFWTCPSCKSRNARTAWCYGCGKDRPAVDVPPDGPFETEDEVFPDRPW